MKTIFHGVVSSPFVIVATTKTGILSRTMIFFLIPYQVVFVGKPIQSMSKVEMGGEIGNSTQTKKHGFAENVHEVVSQGQQLLVKLNRSVSLLS